MKFIPQGKRLLVRVNRVKEKNVGGIVIPDKHSELTRIAIVDAVGDGAKDQFKPGDIVMLGFNEGDVIHLVSERISDDTYRMVPSNSIQAKIEDLPEGYFD